MSKSGFVFFMQGRMAVDKRFNAPGPAEVDIDAAAGQPDYRAGAEDVMADLFTDGKAHGRI